MKKILFSIAAIAMALSSQAQLLWKVTGGDSKGDSYVFGTHHIAPVAILDSIQGFADALNSVSTVYGELDVARGAAGGDETFNGSCRQHFVKAAFSRATRLGKRGAWKIYRRNAYRCCPRPDEAGSGVDPARSDAEHGGVSGIYRSATT